MKNALGKSQARSAERRRHVMYVTRNSEYHFEGAYCVAVRDRVQGRWRMTHSALQRQLSGVIRYAHGEAYPVLQAPCVGDALFFSGGGTDLVTSELMAIERPPKELVESYPI